MSSISGTWCPRLMSEAQGRLESAGLRLPDVQSPVAAYLPATRTGSLVFTAGQVPRQNGVVVFPGKVDGEVAVEAARDAVRIAALQALAAVKGVVGDLDRVTRIVKLTVFVNSSPGFSGQPHIADAASQVLTIAFDEAGRHARSVIGVAELPLDSSVELELIAEVD